MPNVPSAYDGRAGWTVYFCGCDQLTGAEIEAVFIDALNRIWTIGARWPEPQGDSGDNFAFYNHRHLQF